MAPYTTRTKHKRQGNSQLQAHPYLLTIDGVDGSGKSSIAKAFFELMVVLYGNENVALHQVTNLCGTPGQERLAKQLEKNSFVSENLCYQAGVNRAYNEAVLPDLCDGKIVIIDRSEVDLLRYSLGTNELRELSRRKKSIEVGDATCGLFASYRIFVEASAEDVWHNLNNRGHRSKYDPQTIEEVARQLEAQREAESMIMGMRVRGNVEVLRVSNNRAKVNVEGKLRDTARELAAIITL